MFYKICILTWSPTPGPVQDTPRITPCPFLKQIFEKEYYKSPRWKAGMNINASAIELKQRK